jgi:hypothetical protein
MRTALSRALLAAALFTLAGSGCGYSPNPANGTLACGPAATCPEEYRCASDGYCWRDTGGPSTCGTTAADKLIGHWVFVAPSRRIITCSDGSGLNEEWIGDYVDVEAGGSAALRAFYYCDLDLDIAATGSTILRPGSSCSAQDTLDPTITYTWTAQIFTLSTGDGCSGTLAASIPFVATDPAGSASCSMDFTGTLTKS